MKKDTITLLVNGEAAFPEIIRCIEYAKSSIEINMFIWRDDRIGNRIAEAILSAADRGVKVYLSVDRYGVVLEKSEECKRSFFHKTQSIGEKVKISTLKLMYPKNSRRGNIKDTHTEIYTRVTEHPNIAVSADEFKADHSKYYIVDNEILFLGGINIEDKENGCDINGNIYGDYMVKLCGREYVEAFRYKMNTGKNILDGLSFAINVKKPTRIFEMEQLYLDLISSAKTELHITMAYFSPLKKFVDAIVEAHERGVHISVLIPGKANFQNDCNRLTVRKLLKATNGQIEVYLSPKMLHTKLVANDTYISLGSTNITKKAFAQLNELNLFVRKTGSELEQTLAASISDDIKEAQRVRRYQDIPYNRLIAFLERFFV